MQLLYHQDRSTVKRQIVYKWSIASELRVLGETYLLVKIRALTGIEREEVRLLVDTGATYSWVSRKILEKLSVKPSRRMRFKTIRGDVVEREVGHVLVEYEGEEAPTIVVFAEDGDGDVFGLHGLESLGLEVDPVTRQVRKSEALLAL
jgi:predicted aspartyl protease